MTHSERRVTGVSRGEQLLFVQKEIRNIMKNTDLNKTTDFVVDDSDISKFTMIITPIEGLYVGLSIPFELTVPQDYPLPGAPIDARCIENIYHPNIFEKGRLCLKYDTIGNLGVGYKETLENLVVAINYLFLHPENYGNDMPDDMKSTILKNIDAYKNRVKNSKIPKSQDDPMYKIQEIYGENINQSLSKINDWYTYFPDVCSRNIKKSRYYMFTLGGRKLMDMAKLEDVFSQIIRDPRFRFDTVASLGYVTDVFAKKQLTEPSTPHSVLLSKYKRIVYPNDLMYDSINGAYNSEVNFNAIINTYSPLLYSTSGKITFAMCNIVIKSNYRFKFSCHKDKNPHFPALESVEKKDEFEMKIDQYVCGSSINIANNTLMVYDEPNPNKPLWFYISCSMIYFGEHMHHMFSNIAFKFNPTDEQSPWVTVDNSRLLHQDFRTMNMTTNMHVPIEGTSLRFLTESEIKLISGTDSGYHSSDRSPIQREKDDEDYNIDLAAKYLASSAEQTGLDLSRMHAIS